MERTLDGWGKLYGMRSAYDEVMATGIKRQHEPPRIVGDLLSGRGGGLASGWRVEWLTNLEGRQFRQRHGAAVVVLTGSFALATGWLWEPATSRRSERRPQPLAWFASAGILATLWGRLTLFKAIEFAGVIRASTVRRLTPFFSVFLAWLFLGELVGMATGWGMALIAASFLLLIATAAPSSSLRRSMRAVLRPELHRAKARPTQLPDALLGAMVCSLAALGYYALGGVFSVGLRKAMADTLVRRGRWHFATALFIFVGKISQFIALTYTGVSQVALINPVEICIAAYLAVGVVRLESMLRDRQILRRSGMPACSRRMAGRPDPNKTASARRARGFL